MVTPTEVALRAIAIRKAIEETRLPNFSKNVRRNRE